VAVGDGHVAGVGPAEAHRYAEALGGPDHHVYPVLAGRRHETEGQEVGCDGHTGSGLPEAFDGRAEVA
jgi:hypothetical protein